MKKTPVKESRGFHGFDPLPPRGRPVSKELIDKLRREGMAEAEAIEEELDADLYLQEISRKLTEKFGDLNEGRTLASMREVLYQRFGMEVTAPRARAWNGDRSMEVGLLAYSGRRDEVFVVEVTNHLREEDLDRMRRMLHVRIPLKATTRSDGRRPPGRSEATGEARYGLGGRLGVPPFLFS